jgi:hypothetical protein
MYRRGFSAMAPSGAGPWGGELSLLPRGVYAVFFCIEGQRKTVLKRGTVAHKQRCHPSSGTLCGVTSPDGIYARSAGTNSRRNERAYNAKYIRK